MSDYFPITLNDGKHIFVFGSNEAGRHGKGAALTARQSWGAIYGNGRGRQGASYAIPTKDNWLQKRPLDLIAADIDKFLDYANTHKDLTFLVTKVGCGLAGYYESVIAPLFAEAPENCRLPEGWRKLAEREGLMDQQQ